MTNTFIASSDFAGLLFQHIINDFSDRTSIIAFHRLSQVSRRFHKVAKRFLITHNSETIIWTESPINGRRHGLLRRWRMVWTPEACMRGPLLQEDIYVNGSLHGVRKGWYPSGQQHFSAYCQNNRMHGPQLVWYPSGGLEYEYYNFNGRRHGLCKRLHENGILAYAYEYHHGELKN